MRLSGFLVCACLVTVALTACGGGRRLPDRRDDSMVVQQRADGTQVAVRPGRDPNAAYIQATELKGKGDCAGAIVLLRPVARMGPGYENAQTALGECLILQADEREDGLIWLGRAADAGWPEAQAALALAYGADSPAHNGEEAAYWLALYDINPSKARVGFRAADVKALSTLRASLSDTEKAAGARRAASWQRKLWLPPADAEGPGLKPEQRGRGGFRGPGPQL